AVAAGAAPRSGRVPARAPLASRARERDRRNRAVGTRRSQADAEGRQRADAEPSLSQPAAGGLARELLAGARACATSAFFAGFVIRLISAGRAFRDRAVHADRRPGCERVRTIEDIADDELVPPSPDEDDLGEIDTLDRG